MSDESPYHHELSWCPECQSPPNSDFAHLQYCQRHMPVSHGELDRLVDNSDYIASGDAGGESNKQFCDLFHRGKE